MLCAAQQAQRQRIQVAVCVARIQCHGDLLLREGRLFHALRKHQRIASGQHQRLVAVNAVDRGCEHIRRLAAEFIGVQHRGLRPVAIEAEIRNGQIRLRFRAESHKALDIAAVRIILFKVSAVGIAQTDGHRDQCVGARLHEQRRTVQSRAGNRHVRRIRRQYIRLLRHVLAVGRDCLGQDAGAERVALRLAAGVLHMELHGVGAGLLGIVAQLDLRALTAIDIEVGIRSQRRVQIHKARALLSRRDLHAVLRHRHSRGHEQAVCQRLHLTRAQRRVLFVQIFPHRRRNAGHIRRSHRRAGHILVSVVERDGGIDPTAGRRDLGLQLQRRKRPPRREAGHRRLADIAFLQRDLLRLRRSHHLAACQRDGGRRDADIRDGHAGSLALAVVVDQAGNRTGRSRVQLLLLKGNAAALNDGDLSADIQIAEIAHIARAGNHDIRIAARAKLRREVVAGEVGIGDLRTGCAEIVVAGSVDAGHAQIHLIARRGRNDAVVHIGRRGIVARRCAIGRRIAVARRNAHRNAAFVHQTVDLIEQAVRFLRAEAARRAKAHVDDVNADQHRVGKRRQNGRRRRAAAAVAEYLENGKLRLGRCAGEGHIALRIHGLTGRDTGNVCAVVVAKILYRVLRRADVRVVIGIVKCKRYLAVFVKLIRRQEMALTGCAEIRRVGMGRRLAVLRCVKEALQIVLVQLLALRLVYEGLMRRIQAGIQNTDQHTFAEVVRRIGKRCACRIDGVVHALVREILRLFLFVCNGEHNVADAAQLTELRDVAIADPGRKAAQQRRIGIRRFSAQLRLFHLGLDRRLDRGDLLQLTLRRSGLHEIAEGHLLLVHLLLHVIDRIYIQKHDDVHHLVLRRQHVFAQLFRIDQAAFVQCLLQKLCLFFRSEVFHLFTIERNIVILRPCRRDHRNCGKQHGHSQNQRKQALHPVFHLYPPFHSAAWGCPLCLFN